MASVKFEDIRALYGLRLDAPEVTAFLARYPDHRIGRPSDGVQQVDFRSLGFDLSFMPRTGMQGGRTKELRVLDTVFLHRKGHERYEGFAEPPFGISFADTREILIQKLGEPSGTSMPDGVKVSPFGTVYWDRWHVEDLAVHVTYDSVARTPSLISISPL